MFSLRFISLFTLVGSISLFSQGKFVIQHVTVVTTNEVWIDFPEIIDFHLVATADSAIQTAELEYGIEGLTCGEVTSLATPTFEPTTELNLTWRWNVLDGDIIPPGGRIWWRWNLTTENGDTLSTPTKTAVFLDSWFVWQTVSAENLTVHWYRGPQNLGQQMLDAGLVAINQLATDTGLRLEESIDLYLYDESFDLQISVPGTPNWAGGVAFPEYNIVLVTANKDHLEYGADTVRHELGHVVIGRLTFNCLNQLPTWLNEGLAMVAEGTAANTFANTLAEAITSDNLLTLPQLDGGFSVHTDRALLSYAESYSIVRYLIDTYGSAQMLTLLETFRAGKTPDEAFMTAYGFDLGGVENEWRLFVGANPRPQTAETINNQPTVVPTLSLLNPIAVITATPTTLPPTVTSEPPPTETAVPPTTTPHPLPTTLPTPEPIDTPFVSWLPFVSIGGFVVLSLVILFVFRSRR